MPPALMWQGWNAALFRETQPEQASRAKSIPRGPPAYVKNTENLHTCIIITALCSSAMWYSQWEVCVYVTRYCVCVPLDRPPSTAVNMRPGRPSLPTILKVKWIPRTRDTLRLIVFSLVESLSLSQRNTCPL